MNGVNVASSRGLNRFIAKSLLWMMVGLLISSLSAFVLLKQYQLLYIIVSNRLLYFSLFIVQIILATSLRVDPNKLDKPIGYIVKFVAYSMMTGVTFAIVALVYTETSIVQAFISSAALFALLSIYGYTTKRDLTRLGSFLLPACLAVIVVSIINLFFFNDTVSFMLAVATMIIFIGFTMYDMQKIKGLYYYFGSQSRFQDSLAIVCALELYLDFINLFLSILRIFGRRRD